MYTKPGLVGDLQGDSWSSATKATTGATNVHGADSQYQGIVLFSKDPNLLF
jgi:hypothetical protein